MLTSKSPRTVMLAAHALALESLPAYRHRFSRHDFTLPQLFACLVVKEMMHRTYRSVEALLHDSEDWCRAIGMKKVPDHNTLCRAAKLLLSEHKVNRVLDVTVRWAAKSRTMLKLSKRPLAIDSTIFEVRHVSRYFEFRRGRGGGNAGKRRKINALPKLAISVASASHLILSCQSSTGGGTDHPHFDPLLFDAWRRVPNRRFTVVADAGYDGEARHRFARDELRLKSIMPPRRAWKTGAPPNGRWRRLMKKLLKNKRSRKRCGYNQRWQVETTASMLKRNLGSALRGKTKESREREMMLRVLTHNIMLLTPDEG
jgi:hypothetical protein